VLLTVEFLSTSSAKKILKSDSACSTYVEILFEILRHIVSRVENNYILFLYLIFIQNVFLGLCLSIAHCTLWASILTYCNTL